MPFITVGAKSPLVAMAIVQTSKTIKSSALRSKAQDYTLFDLGLAFAAVPRKMG
jgi:hypothetical protein